MKKAAYLLLLITAFSSCSENITRNSPAVQGLKDDVLWRAAGITATKTHNNHITITGVRQLETLVLRTSSITEATYILGESGQRSATFTSTNGFGETVWSTGSTNSSHGDGEIVITEWDDENQTISGTFRFNAVNQADGAEDDVMNWQSGVFYDVPVVSETE